MVVRNTRRATNTGARTSKPAPAAQRRAPAKAAPAAAKAERDVTQYATKEPTDYHKAYANWIVKYVGYRPSEAASAKEAFLMGVSIATAARPAFNDSDYLEKWRERTGMAKRGPKPKADEDEAPVAKTRRRRAPEPEPEVEDDDDDEFEDADDDDEFDDEEDDTSEFEDDDEDEFEEPEPTPKRRGRPAAKATPAKRAAEDDTDDDGFIF